MTKIKSINPNQLYIAQNAEVSLRLAGNSTSTSYNNNQAVRLTNINDDDIIINYDSAGNIISTLEKE